MTTARVTPTTRARKTTAPRKTASKPVTQPVKVETAPVPVSEAPETILIHFVSEGFCAFGTVWAKGQELEIEVPSLEYDRTCDVNGDSWLRLSPKDQESRWGEVKFRPGPSDLPNSVINYITMSADGNDSYGRPKYSGYMSTTDREKAAEAEKQRGRKVPVI